MQIIIDKIGLYQLEVLLRFHLDFENNPAPEIIKNGPHLEAARQLLRYGYGKHGSEKFNEIYNKFADLESNGPLYLYIVRDGTKPLLDLLIEYKEEMLPS